MNKKSLTLHFNGSEILLVPAVHYRAVFAREVNYLCYDESTRPEAVAVELGPYNVCEIISWMKELGHDKPDHEPLPCMLGLLIKNRLIHPEYFDTALLIQKQSGKPLRDISSEIKSQLLYYSGNRLLGISATDSIIEAIRCGVELNIPVYGIDIEEFASRPDSNVLIHNPSIKSFDLNGFTCDNAGVAHNYRDNWVDSRREYVMAARLKYIASRHKRILFTGGLAHWKTLTELMENENVRPADFLKPEISPEISRVIIHPKIALRFMDNFPVLTTIYENNRKCEIYNKARRISLPDYHKVSRKILGNAYKKYACGHEFIQANPLSGFDKDRKDDFERLTEYLRLLNQHAEPSMTDLIESSLAMMPSGFSRQLMSRLMDIGRRWADNEQFPSVPLLASRGSDPDHSNRNGAICEFELDQKFQGNDRWKYITRKNYGRYIITNPSALPLSDTIMNLWDWEAESKESGVQPGNYCWEWPPAEALLYGSAYEAIREVSFRTTDFISEPFEGTLHNGIDIKSTIRSLINSENKIYVRKPVAKRRKFTLDAKHPDPLVFIFTDEETGRSSRWSLMLAGMSMRKLLRNKKLYDSVVRKYGPYFVPVVERIHTMEVPDHLRGYIDSYDLLDGITELGNPCINARQGAAWLEDNDFNACPVLHDTSMEKMKDFYSKSHKISLSSPDWRETLVRFAIPYAKERILLIAPSDYRISGSILSEARKRNISIDRVPLSFFPQSRIDEMRKRIMVRASDPDGLQYPPEVEKVLGQKSDKYFDLLPAYMQNQLKNHNKKSNEHF